MDELKSKSKREGRPHWRRVALPIALGIGATTTIFIVALLWLIFTLTQPVVDAGNDFLTAVQDGDLETAYALLAPELTEEVSRDTFGEQFTNAQLESWSFNSRSIKNNIGRVRGNAVMRGERHALDIQFRHIDGQWRVISYRLFPA